MTGKGSIIMAGLGLNMERETPLGVIEAAKECDAVYLEAYTSMDAERKTGFREILGTEVEVLDRSEVEEKDLIVEAALEGKRVLFLTFGDPLVATTHQEMRLRAVKQGIRVDVIHAGSVLAAVPGLLGLQHYKFGRTTTLARRQGDYFPTSPYDVIKDNKKRGLHTMILLEIDTAEDYVMTAGEGITILEDMEKKKGEGIMKGEALICVVSRAGTPVPGLWSAKLSDLRNVNFGPTPHTIVVPGKLHFMEAETLVQLGADKGILEE